MTTPALTTSDFGEKLSAIQSYITPATLDLINRSETLKDVIRTYQADSNEDPAVRDLSPGQANAAMN